jgi:tRNA-uridine 2-sulfurtransferase
MKAVDATRQLPHPDGEAAGREPPLATRADRAGTVMVGLSGGVDSAVSALLLRRAGHPVEAVFMKNWEEDDRDDYCPIRQDLDDAEHICETLGITLHTANFSDQYWDRVFTEFLHEYGAGHTPNPDILCNREIKFRAFLDHASLLGAAHIATGHYARLLTDDTGTRRLYKGKDPEKDQSYFLYALDQSQLQQALFPVGELGKREVRRCAREAGRSVHDKRDSTGICFIGERPFGEFLRRYVQERPGPVMDPDGRILGEHKGLPFHTLGQRRGLGIGGLADAGGEPWYVAGKDAAQNALIVVQGREHPLLYSGQLTTRGFHWIAGEAPGLPLRAAAKTRYRQPDQPCTLTACGQDCVHIVFDDPQWAVTPGQSVVVYDGDECLGGGIINETVGTLAP